MFTIKLYLLSSCILVNTLSFECCAMEQGSLIEYYEKLIEEYNANMFAFEFPKNNSDFFLAEPEEVARNYGTFDFIIIGAGSAGTVIANRLTEISDWNILLIEAGGEEDDFSDIPAVFTVLQASRMNWGYLTTPQTTCCLGMENNQCAYPRGKVLGGSSSINAVTYARGNRRDFDLWEQMGNQDWNYEEVLPYFKKSENSQLYFNEYHGQNGPLNVEYSEPPSPLLQTFLDANKELGRQYLDYNGEKQLGFSRIQTNIRNGKRVSGGNAFIKPIRERKNLNISLNSLVTKILVETDAEPRAYGVEFIYDGIKYRATTTKEVILSAGTINSPQILKLSGIGPKQELDSFNITIVNDLPMVGKNLKDHAFNIGLNFHTNFTENLKNLKGKIEDYLNGTGALTSAGSGYGIGFFDTSDEKSGRPDIEYLFLTPSDILTEPRLTYNFKDNIINSYLKNINATNDILLFVILLHPKSSGEVRLKSGDFKDFPDIDVNYLSDENDQDVETMYKGMQFILNLTKTDAFRKIGAVHFAPNPDCDFHDKSTQEYWHCMIRSLTSTLYHPIGTTRMGRSEEDSVVDSHLNVHNMKNLRVADAGVMPSTISGHTSAATFMIGERVSDFIKIKYGV